MTQKEKRFQRLIQNPKSTSIQELTTILNDCGYGLARISGSHYIFARSNSEVIVVAVHNNRIKKSYIKKLIKKLNETRKL